MEVDDVIKRAAILHPTNYYPDGSVKNHLCVVMCDPGPAPGEILLAPICTYNPNSRRHDSTCIIQPGEHEFIKRESYVSYQLSKATTAIAVQRLIDNGLCQRYSDVDEGLFERILDGYYTSKFSTPFMKGYFF